MLPITFYYPYPDEIKLLDELDLRSYAFWSHEGKERRRAWVLQTYLWLKHFGYDVQISSTVPNRGTVVLIPETETLAAFQYQHGTKLSSLLVVTIRADVLGYRCLFGDLDITQNGRFANGYRTVFIPHWPQPGLVPRDPERDVQIENIVFKGGFGSLDADFRSSSWLDRLAQRGISFHIASAHTEGSVPNWHDYRTADLNLAVRPSFNDRGLRCEKPASKLVNAWHAGVPSLLGREYPFLELRRTPLDYVEVTTPDEAICAIDHLRSNPDLYLQMIDHGRRRAREFTAERIAKRWAHVLFSHVSQIAKSRTYRWSRFAPSIVRRAVNFFAAPPQPYEFRKRIGHLSRRLPFVR